MIVPRVPTGVSRETRTSAGFSAVRCRIAGNTGLGEADVSLEWMVVRLAFAANVAFHIAGLIALGRLRP